MAAEKRELTRVPTHSSLDPFTLLRQMTAELDRAFDEPFWRARHWPLLRTIELPETATWAPRVDVFERDNRLVAKVDLPGVKKEDVTVQVTDGHLVMSGERKQEKEEKKNRAVPLPDGVKLEDVKATFADGVVEVSVPLPARAEPTVRKVEIQEPAKPGDR